MHEFLTHLARAGFDGAPRVLGLDDQQREVLTFIDGEVLADPTWQPGDPGPWPGPPAEADPTTNASQALSVPSASSGATTASSA